MTEMRIASVNLGRPLHIPGHNALTGIVKTPLGGPVAIGPLGLEGDAVMDKKNHGGLDQAVYLYGAPDYAFFAKELGRPLEPGLFGENLTVAGLESATVNIGDQFEIGDLLLEATSSRNPCATFAARMNDPLWVKRFFDAARPGFYARVLRPGAVEAGMNVQYLPYKGERVPVTELMRDYKNPAPERMRWLLKAPIHRDLAAKYEAALAQL
jgi:MOSC domain-containing protein YiiM